MDALKVLLVTVAAGALHGAACAQDRAPTVHAGNDTTIRLGLPFSFLSATSSDPDQDPLTYAWTLLSGPAGGASIEYPDALGTRVDFSSVGTYQFKITVSDGTLGAADTIKVTVQDSLKAQVQRPAAGEKVLAGSTYKVTWQLNAPETYVNVRLSTNGGRNFELLNSAHVSNGSFNWTVGQAPSDSCYLQIVSYQTSALLAQSGRFSIVSHPDSAANAVRRAAGEVSAGAGNGPRASVNLRPIRAEGASRPRGLTGRAGAPQGWIAPGFSVE